MVGEVAFRIISYGSAHFSELLRLRERVLRNAIGISFLDEEIEAERDWIHIAGFLNGAIVASAALVVEENAVGKICRVAVLEALQGKGIGAAIMEFTERYAASESAISKIYLHARTSSMPFYRALHYVQVGEEFVEDTIVHARFEKKLKAR